MDDFFRKVGIDYTGALKIYLMETNDSCFLQLPFEEMTQILYQRESTMALVKPAFVSLQNVRPFTGMLKAYLLDAISKYGKTNQILKE